MSAYDDGRSEYTASRYYDERRYQRDPRYAESRDNHTRGQVASRDLVPRYREESDYSVEEIHRDFPPPTYSRDAYRSYEDDRRPRSSKDRDYDYREGKKTRSTTYEDDKKRRRMLSNQEKILAAVIGGALAVGGKELYDRREAQQDGRGIHRNALSSAALGAAGAFAAYQGADLYNKHATKEEQKTLAYKGRDGRGVDTYSDDNEDSDYGSKERKGHKNFLEGALAAAGLGGAVKALTGGSTGHRDDSRSRSQSRSGSRSRGKGGKSGGTNKIQKAAMASLIAGATEAFRVAKEPGSWKGEKAKRVLTAAAGAATIDAAHDDKHSKMGIAESVIGGLLGNRIVNGSRRNIEEDRRTGRSRSRSRARSEGGGGGGGVSGLAALATAGLGALGTKKILESRERSRSRRRSSVDSYDSRHRSPDRSRRSRSRSVVDTARRSLAKIGLGNGPDDDYPADESPRHKKSSSRRNDRRDSADSHDDDRRHGGGRDRGEGRSGRYENDDNRSARRRSGSRSRRDKGGSRHDSESDLGSSSEDEKRAKKMRGKQIVTTGLAAVATIHAAHSVYQSMEKRQSRRRAVQEGRLSSDEAKKLKNQALLRDAASVGIAALGIKGAFSELKEAREAHLECKEWKEEKEKRHLRRLEHMQRSQSSGRSSRKVRNRASSVPPQAGWYYNDLDNDASDDEPRLVHGSSYATLPAPPVGTEARRHVGSYRN